jgi:hypothetical protein
MDLPFTEPSGFARLGSEGPIACFGRVPPGHASRNTAVIVSEIFANIRCRQVIYIKKCCGSLGEYSPLSEKS